MAQVFIGLGSNRGDRLKNMRRAVAAISGFAEDMICSSVYESPALLPQDAPKEWDEPFLNAVIAAGVSLQPMELLKELKRIEQELGRKKEAHWAPREIDLDILAYGNRVTQEDGLTIPHPQMVQRDFVLLPLAEVAGDWQFPARGRNKGKTVAQLVAERHSDATIRKTAETLRV